MPSWISGIRVQTSPNIPIIAPDAPREGVMFLIYSLCKCDPSDETVPAVKYIATNCSFPRICTAAKKTSIIGLIDLANIPC